jgi:hypothetical protein
MKKILRQPLAWLAFIALAVAMLWPRLSKKDRFPYVGTWQGDTISMPGYGTRLSFNKDGSCSSSSTSPQGDYPQSCKYEMRGEKTFITLSMSDKDGTSTLIYVSALPQNNGLVLLYDPIDSVTLDSNGKRIRYLYFKEPSFKLQRENSGASKPQSKLN